MTSNLTDHPEDKFLPDTATVDDLIARARSLAQEPGRRILGITGAPGSGKSTLAAQLVQALGTELAVLVPMDGFHLSNRILIEQGLRDVKGAPSTFDSEGFAELLKRIRQQTHNGTIYAPYFDRTLEESIAGGIRVHPDIPLIITEGNYLLLESDAWPRARQSVTETWFLAPDREVRLQRLIERHIHFGKSPKDAQAWALGTDEANAQLVESMAFRADRTIKIGAT